MIIKIQGLKAKYNLDIKNILHIGAHNAEEIGDYLEIGVEQIHWVEANKELASHLDKILNPNFNKVSTAVVSEKDDEEVVFKIANNSASSSILDLGEHKQLFPSVHYIAEETRKTTTIDKLMEDTNLVGTVDFINIDIQGAELLALKGATKTLENTKSIYLEINDSHVYANCALTHEIDDYLSSFGFKRVEKELWQSHPWGDAFYIK